MSSAVSAIESAPPFSTAWAARAALEIASTALSRRRNARAAWCVAIPRLFAIAARALPRDERDAMGLAPRKDGVLYRSLLQVIEHLIASDTARAGNLERFVEVGDVEI